MDRIHIFAYLFFSSWFVPSEISLLSSCSHVWWHHTNRICALVRCLKKGRLIGYQLECNYTTESPAGFFLYTTEPFPLVFKHQSKHTITVMDTHGIILNGWLLCKFFFFFFPHFYGFMSSMLTVKHDCTLYLQTNIAKASFSILKTACH